MSGAWVIKVQRPSDDLPNQVQNQFWTSELANTILSKWYYNERNLGPPSFFDTSTSRFRKACISNAAKSLVENWNFDWLFLTPDNFRKMLAYQLNPIGWILGRLHSSTCNVKSDLIQAKLKNAGHTKLEVFSTRWCYPTVAESDLSFVHENPGFLLRKKKSFCDKTPGIPLLFFHILHEIQIV